jgi:hypothetical protein
MHLGYIFLTLFAWPAGIVLGNLIANFFWLPVQWTGLHLKLAAHHGKVHDKLDDILARLDACPNCGHSRSAADLQPRDEAS